MMIVPADNDGDGDDCDDGDGEGDVNNDELTVLLLFSSSSSSSSPLYPEQWTPLFLKIVMLPLGDFPCGSPIGLLHMTNGQFRFRF